MESRCGCRAWPRSRIPSHGRPRSSATAHGLSDVAELAEIDTRQAADAGTVLVRSGLLQAVDPIEFTHPVVRAAIEGGLNAGERAAMHGAAARVLMDRGAPPEQAASHAMRALPSGDGFVVDTLRRAADRSRSRGASETAVAYLRRALDEPPPDDERADVLAELGRAEQLVDVPAALDHLTMAARLTTDSAARARLTIEQAQCLSILGRPPEVVQVLSEALRDLADGEPDLRERLLADIIGEAVVEPELYRAAVAEFGALEGEALHGGPGSDALLAILAEIEVHAGDRARAIELARRALASGRLVARRPNALFGATTALFAAGELDQVDAVVADALQVARRTGDIASVAVLTDTRALSAAHRGDLLSAERDVGEALELAEVCHLRNTILFGAALAANIAVEQDRLHDAEATLAAIGDVTDEMPRPHQSFVLDARGRLRFVQRRYAEAAASFERLGAVAESVDVSNPGLLAYRSRLALALHALGHAERARAEAGAELAHARAWGAPRPIGISLRALALVSETGAREPLLREALDVLERSPARLEQARVLVDLGALLRRGKRRSDARQLLRDGVELAHRCGAAALVARGNEEIAATGARPRRLVVTGLESLTASERRVAQMAAEGMTNRQVAQALFVTPRTVDAHLGSSNRKLGIRSRTELSAALASEAPSAARN
jgi:DNA-binding CsgD family transcriptional regulator